MRYLVGPQNGIWVAVTGGFANENSDEETAQKLRQKTKAIQTLFFDLDDNHADSPAKKIALGRVGTSGFSPRFIWWALTQGAPAKFIKSRESEAWKKYVNNFLRSEEALQEVRALYTEETAHRSLYKGVDDFCRLVHSSERFYVTRNIAEVADAYASALGFNGFFPESDNKERVVEDYVKRHPHVERFGVDGDSEEDVAMIDVLRFYDKDVLGFYSMVTPNDCMHPKFDVSVSKDRSGLVQLLRS